MHPIYRYLAAGLVALSAAAASAQEETRRRGTYQAERGGWMMGMFVGEEKAKPYPFVTEMEPKSEAKKKGIRVGDEIIRFQDQETRPLSRIFEQYNKLRPGKVVAVWVRRGGQQLRFDLSVPKDPGSSSDEEKVAKEKAEKDGESAEGEGKKKKEKKKRPVVIKPIPAPEP
jgi:S1-C subfamily serine protease